MSGVRRFTIAERRLRLGRYHRLDGSGRDRGSERSGFDGAAAAVEVARDVVALHSSDPVTVFLSVLARSRGASIESVEQALYRDRTLVRVHGMRRTLWVSDRDIGSDIVAACRSRLLAANRTRFVRALEEAGIADDGEAWIAAAGDQIMAHLHSVGSSDTRSIGLALPHLTAGFDAAPGTSSSTVVAAHTRILLQLGFEGRVIRADPLGSWIASQYRWATTGAWLGPEAAGWASADEDEARGRMVGRYLLAFGPVTEADLTWWTGWPKRVVARALAGHALVEVDLDGETGWLLDGGAETEPLDPDREEAPWVAVLPALDPTTMGWRARDWYLDPAMVDALFDRNGNAGPTVWADGRVVGGWAQRADGELVYRLLADVGAEHRAAIDAELEILRRRLGDSRFKVRFKTPLNEALRA